MNLTGRSNDSGHDCDQLEVTMSLMQEDQVVEPGLPLVRRDAAGKLMPPWPRPVELRKLPAQLQQEILAASAANAEHEYPTNRDLTDFDAFAEEP
jgi:hypothetical protein